MRECSCLRSHTHHCKRDSIPNHIKLNFSIHKFTWKTSAQKMMHPILPNQSVNMNGCHTINTSDELLHSRNFAHIFQIFWCVFYGLYFNMIKEKKMNFFKAPTSFWTSMVTYYFCFLWNFPHQHLINCSRLYHKIAVIANDICVTIAFGNM